MDLAHPAFGWWPSCKKIGFKLQLILTYKSNPLSNTYKHLISKDAVKWTFFFPHLYCTISLLSAFLVYFSGKFQFEFLTLFHVTLLVPQVRGESARIIKGVMINKNNPSKFGLWIIITRQIRFYKQLEQSHLGCITFSKNLNTYQWSF